MPKFYQITNKSFKELKVKSHKELWEKVKKDHKGLNVLVNTEFKQNKKDKNMFDVIMSTSAEDRHGDVIKQKWELANFKKNPVFLDSHNYNSIEYILGKVHNIRVEKGALRGTVEFALDNPKGKLAFKLAKNGFLSATSVGFIPLEFNDKGVITKSELLEDSAVSVPANQEALFEKKVKKSKKKKVTKKTKRAAELKKIEKELKTIKKRNICNEILAVTKQLSQVKVDKDLGKQKVNRAIKLLMKIKKL